MDTQGTDTSGIPRHTIKQAETPQRSGSNLPADTENSPHRHGPEHDWRLVMAQAVAVVAWVAFLLLLGTLIGLYLADSAYADWGHG